MNQGDSTGRNTTDMAKADLLSAIEQCKNGIVHFDATIVRRHKMRQSAGQRGRTEASASPTSSGHNPSVEPQTHGADANGSSVNPLQPLVAAASGDLAAPAGWWARVVRDASASLQPEPQNGEASVAGSSSADTPVARSESQVSPSLPSSNPEPARSPEPLRAFLVNFVVEQTGYPEDIVEMDADLEADLGIDSIKKAQMFGEIGEYFGIQPDENLSLDDFPNLQSVLEYLIKVTSAGDQTTTDARGDSPMVAPVNGTAEHGPTADVLKTFLINFVVEQTGYPEDIVELDADLEADLGIDSIKKAQMFGEIGEYFGIQPDENLSLDDFPNLQSVLLYLVEVTAAGSHQPAGMKTATDVTSTHVATVADVLPMNAKAPLSSPAVSASTRPHDRMGPTSDDLKTFLINFVVEQTGYPEDIVELDADLEADLGIDSIKKAQLFGEIGEYFGIQPDENLSLDDFRDLRSVLGYLANQVGDSA